jgi:hypothetical protein
VVSFDSHGGSFPSFEMMMRRSTFANGWTYGCSTGRKAFKKALANTGPVYMASIWNGSAQGKRDLCLEGGTPMNM